VEAEAITNTGKPPKNWTYQVEKKIAKLKESSGTSGRILKLEKKAKIPAWRNSTVLSNTLRDLP